MLAGVPLLFSGPAPGTIEESLPEFLVTLWGIELALGGALTLTGLGVGSRPMEKFGLSLLAAAAIVYALVLLATSWPVSVVSAAIVAGFGITCVAVIRWWRTHEVVRLERPRRPE